MDISIYFLAIVSVAALSIGIGEYAQVVGFSLLGIYLKAELMDHMMAILWINFQETSDLFSIDAMHLIFVLVICEDSNVAMSLIGIFDHI